MSILPSILKSLKALTAEVENAMSEKSGKSAPVATKTAPVAPGKKAPPAAPKAPEKKTAPVAPGKKQPGKTAPAAAPVKKGAKTHGGFEVGQKVKATWDDGSTFTGTIDKLGEIGKFKGHVRVAFVANGETDPIWFAPEEFGMLTLAKGKKAAKVEEPEEEEIDEEADEEESEDEESEDEESEDEQSSDDEDSDDEDDDESEDDEDESEDEESEDEEDEEPAPKKTIVTKKNADADATKMMAENVKMAKIIDASSECAKHGCQKLIKSGSCTLKSVAECNRQLKAETAKREKGGSKKPGKK